MVVKYSAKGENELSMCSNRCVASMVPKLNGSSGDDPIKTMDRRLDGYLVVVGSDRMEGKYPEPCLLEDSDISG